MPAFSSYCFRSLFPVFKKGNIFFNTVFQLWSCAEQQRQTNIQFSPNPLNILTSTWCSHTVKPVSCSSCTSSSDSAFKACSFNWGGTGARDTSSRGGCLSGWYGEGCFSIIKRSSGLNWRHLILTQATPVSFCEANKDVNLDMLRAGFRYLWDFLIIPAISQPALVTFNTKGQV